MASKDQRHRAIQEIISRENISTQAELVDRLRKQGYNVTQATVSRDINELRLVRVPLGRGKHKYALTQFELAEDVMDELKRIFRGFVHDVDRGENLLVLRTAEGHASGIALLLDRLRRDDIVGTIAGEDTILVVARSTADAEKLQDEMEGYLV
ncbi:MAG: arginine repressor [Deinococcota bacterium]|uniref:Arginine repressor n=1 Tax=Allomeiothermus silvanus (strain ATCC 700542 / DSM 9946 / NBRC 106475 / NCIMB 13440 / VI-R2) TaxID=526227 RepID=D7BEH2_ALLS1|nr:arginine repressor [Allomeiothermus silvanus]ADH63215.1 arginine repressor, ArgR [Allomeiothermus silvanus DSM 9946]MBI5812809.1 arginine repressor [Allomeiothermus silvanus]MCL6568179.1 arginine repressor [Allomeiothermus silvanus]